MTTSNIPSPYDVGLHGDAALRYAIVQMVVASPHCMPNNYLPTAEALYEYVKIAATTHWVDGTKCRFVDGVLDRIEAPQ